MTAVGRLAGAEDRVLAGSELAILVLVDMWDIGLVLVLPSCQSGSGGILGLRPAGAPGFGQDGQTWRWSGSGAYPQQCCLIADRRHVIRLTVIRPHGHTMCDYFVDLFSI